MVGRPATLRYRREVGALVLGGLLALGAAVADPEPGPADAEWHRISHPLVPVGFELPPAAHVRVTPGFRLGHLRMRDGRRRDNLLFGLLPYETAAGPRHALEVVFLWVTPSVEGVEPAALAGLLRDFENPGVVKPFLRAALYPDQPDVRLEESGVLDLGAHRARRVELEWRALSGTRHERAVKGEAVVLPVHALAALAVVCRFGGEVPLRQRRELFHRLVRSIRLESEIPL